MNLQNSPDAAAWTTCSPGTLQQLGNRLRAARRRKTTVRIGTPVVMIALVALGVWSTYQPTTPSEFNFDAITCREVEANMERYATGQLPPDAMHAFAIHLANCPLCQEKMRGMQRGAMPIGAETKPSMAETVAQWAPSLLPKAEKSPEGITLNRSLIASR